MNERNENRRRLHDAQAGLDYLLEVLGDDLAKKQGYRELDGLDAIRYYLMQKHHWLPSAVKAMSMEDLHFAMHEEMQGWTAPKEALP